MAEKIALVGAETLLGREVRDVLEESRFAFNLQLVAAPGEEEGKVTEAAGEPAILAKLSRESFVDADAILLACGPETARQVAKFGTDVTLVDLSYGLEDSPAARLRAPILEAHDFRVAHDAIQVIAHPAAIALALVLNRIHPVFAIESAVVQIFEPASERGKSGLDELQAQSVSLLSFQPLPKRVYGAQASYVMLPRYGEEAPVALEDVERRIERHLATLLSNGSGAPMPSLHLVQAPVFHGYTFSLWLQFANRPATPALEQILDDAPVEVRSGDTEAPDNVGVAGQSGVMVGQIRPDRNHPRGMWLWMAADNLKLTADNALQVVQEVL